MHCGHCSSYSQHSLSLSLSPPFFPAYIKLHAMPLLSQFRILPQTPAFLPLLLICPKFIRRDRSVRFSDHPSASALISTAPNRTKSASSIMSLSPNVSNGIETVSLVLENEFDRFVDVANKLSDAAGAVIRTYFRKGFVILDKEDLGPVTIADRAAEESMASIILENFPSHAIYGEDNGCWCTEKSADYVCVLDPIDGTKSFITVHSVPSKPLFGTLIALLHKGKPILGIIDQPVLRERWLGVTGRRTTINGEEISTRTCEILSQAYLYSTSPHMFSGDVEEASARVRSKVGAPQQMASILEDIARENHPSGCSSEFGVDPELDEFMESYCEILYRYKEELSKPFDEARTFLSNIETQLSDLCKVASSSTTATITITSGNYHSGMARGNNHRVRH